MASYNNKPTGQAPTSTGEVDDRVAEFIAGKSNPTPSEAAILAHHQSRMPVQGKTAAAAAAPDRRTRPGAWPSSSVDVASRLASSGFTDFAPDTRWSTLEPAVGDRLERVMQRSKDQWRRPQYEQQQDHHHQQQQQKHNQFGPPHAPATFSARQGYQANEAMSPRTHERVKELLASQREHLLAAVEIDHQLREIWLKQQASGGDNH
ncbi:hypothetical protein LY78DRAFT_672524 [Colletotrichum sublineola]|nr:hypothetical protein LY78DRAFT_672524 [Colletotrichum sublineola]